MPIPRLTAFFCWSANPFSHNAELLFRMTEPEFRNSFWRYKDVVYRFAYRMTGSGPEAEDVVQDCFTALWKRPEGYDPRRGDLRAYLLGIARKRILKRWQAEERYDGGEPDGVCLPLDLV